MKNSLTQRIVLGLLALFLLTYVGLQVWRHVVPQYRTETVYTYTVSESAHLNGIVLRDEVLLDRWLDDGVATYLASDGTKVYSGSTIAEVYRDKADAETTTKLRALQKQREQLEKAQDPGTTAYAHTDVLNKQIFSELGSIVDAVNADSMSNIRENADKLLVLMNTKQIAMGRQENFDDTITRLKAEEGYCRDKITREPELITSTAPGYFIRAIDGYEGKADMDALGQMTVEDLGQLMNLSPKPSSRRVGKLMVGHNWYYAARVPEAEVSKYRRGAAVTLDFRVSGLAPVPATISSVNVDKEASGDAVVIFLSDYINEALVNLRIAQADVNFKSVTGLRVNADAIRFQGIQQGVYIVRGEKLVFRPVTVIYEDSGFVLCLENTDSKSPDYRNSLQQYDAVVIEGTQLYDDKPIKQ